MDKPDLKTLLEQPDGVHGIDILKFPEAELVQLRWLRAVGLLEHRPSRSRYGAWKPCTPIRGRAHNKELQVVGTAWNYRLKRNGQA